MKTILTISRKWHQPIIETTITNEAISISCDLDDFLMAVREELGSITWVFLDATFKAKFDAAAQKVLEGIKAESSKVV